MVGKISLLDCTLRDGGYVNDWEFGNGTITSVFDRLNESGIEIIEIGFLDQRRQFDINRSIQPDTASMSKVYAKVSKKKSMIVAMIDYGTCDIDNLQLKSETFIDGIRVIFKKENMYKAIEFGKKVMEKGYTLFLNMVSITSYSESEVIEFTRIVNEIKPFTVSIVDTYGLLHKERLFFYFGLLDKHLDKEISICYHSHNNFQLAYSNVIEMLKLNTDRDMIVDGTLYGMGKSAGNAPLELLAMHLNENYEKKYDINQILEAIDVSIMPIYEKYRWGYSFNFYMSAKNDCHPEYVKYLKNKRSLSVKALNEILGKIEPETRLKFDKQHIEDLYVEYMLDTIDESSCIIDLSKEFLGKELVLIGPGTSAVKNADKIEEYRISNEATSIAVNFVPEFIKTDFIFFSNPKRYSLMAPFIGGKDIKIIATSNITPISGSFNYNVDFAHFIGESDEIWDNALIILLTLLRKIGVNKVSLAGFDGFRGKVEMNYVNKSFDLLKDYDYLSAVNRLLTKKIKEYRKEMDIIFLTDSIYEEK